MIKNIDITFTSTIDIITPVGEIGGVENCINMLGIFLSKKGFKVRVIQMLSKGVDWTAPCIEYHWFFPPGESHSIKDFSDSYNTFIKNSTSPSVILAVAWPLMVYVAKNAMEGLNQDVRIIAWPHAPIEIYEKANRGSYSDFEYADVICAISRRIANSISENKISTLLYRINNPVKVNHVHSYPRQESRTLLFVGRLSEEKNIPTILGAIALAKSDWNLRIVGDGNIKESLINLSYDFKIENKVQFIGWAKDPWVYAEGIYALVMSSYFEGFPLVAIESLSCGLPVIANKSSGLNEIIQSGLNGYIYNDDDSENLAKLLDKLDCASKDTITPDYCVASAKEFNEQIALFDFYTKIFATGNNRILTDCSYKCRPTDILNETISIIIPCYNVENSLDKCISSILSQSIGLNHIQIIAVNDASTDGTLSILYKYEKKYSDLFCIVDCKTNSGQSTARNTGLHYVTGQYIAFIDSDDCVSTYMIEMLYLAAKCYPVDVVSCLFETFINDSPKDVKPPSIHSELFIKGDSATDKKLLLKNAFDNPVWAKLFSTDFIRRHSAFLNFPVGLKMEDIYFTYNSVALCQSWCHIPCKLYYYRMNPKGTMKSENFKNYYMDIFHVFALTIRAFKDNNCFERFSDELAFAYYKKVFFYISMYMIEQTNLFSEENFVTIKNYLSNTFPNIINNPYLSAEDLDTLKSLLSITTD